jgi:hypothetical protein
MTTRTRRFKPFADDEWKLYFEARAIELSEVWRCIWMGSFEGYLKMALHLSPARYRTWLEQHSGYPLTSTALFDRAETIKKEVHGSPAAPDGRSSLR